MSKARFVIGWFSVGVGVWLLFDIPDWRNAFCGVVLILNGGRVLHDE